MRPKLVVVGGGIAGLSCGAVAVGEFDVTVLEAEDQPGYHSSGRSAAVLVQTLENETVYQLTMDSVADHRRMGARAIGDLMVAERGKEDRLDAHLARWASLCGGLREADPAEVLERVPILRPEKVYRAVADDAVLALDVHGMLESYRRRLKAEGGNLVGGARVQAIERRDGRWSVSAGERRFVADVLVNAAGAWGDEVAALAGVRPLGLQPKRRTAVLVDPGMEASAWPMFHAAGSSFYCKPEGGLLMISPGDATPAAPGDVQAEELDVAMAVDALQTLTRLAIRRVESRWAGLRSFLPDSLPAVGYDHDVENFFWLIGQGGYGLQTAPGLSRVAASLLAGRPHHLAAALQPQRLR